MAERLAVRKEYEQKSELAKMARAAGKTGAKPPERTAVEAGAVKRHPPPPPAVVGLSPGTAPMPNPIEAEDAEVRRPKTALLMTRCRAVGLPRALDSYNGFIPFGFLQTTLVMLTGLFDDVDTDRNGTIDEKELGAMIKQVYKLCKTSRRETVVEEEVLLAIKVSCLFANCSLTSLPVLPHSLTHSPHCQYSLIPP